MNISCLNLLYYQLKFFHPQYHKDELLEDDTELLFDELLLDELKLRLDDIEELFEWLDDELKLYNESLDDERLLLEDEESLIFELDDELLTLEEDELLEAFQKSV